MNELFPIKNGELVKHNFQFTGKISQDKIDEDQRRMAFFDSQMTSSIVGGDVANTFNVSQEMANILDIKNFSQIVRKPKESRIVSIEEFIRRVVSGDTTTVIRPGIDAEDYVFELKLFKRGKLYGSLEQFQKTMIDDALRRAYVMGAAERKAKLLVQNLVNSNFSVGSGSIEPAGLDKGMEQASLSEMQ